MTLAEKFELARALLTGALVLIALAALFIAEHQLSAVRKANDQRLDQAKATFLFELDKLWEGSEFRATRIAFELILEEIGKMIPKHLTDEAKVQATQQKFHELLHKLRSDNCNEYLKLMQLCGFFETAGLLVKKGYIPLDDIADLYGRSILRTDDVFREHIGTRRTRDHDRPELFLTNFAFLADETRKYRARKHGSS